MKRRFGWVLLTLLVFAFSGAVRAQDSSQSATDSGIALRAQLLDVETRQADLKVRADELDEALKPENIERAFVGIGSTRPEELRESRRRQLSIEREGVSKQLALLADAHTRLEAAILSADTRALMQQSSQNSFTNTLSLSSVSPRLVVTGIVVLLGIFSISALVLFIRKR